MWGRSIIVWLLIIGCETVLGTLRQLVLVPMLGEGAVGDLMARRIGVVVGTAMIFTITWLAVRWMCGGRAFSSRRLVLIGVQWAALTFAFEVVIGRLMAMSQTPDGGWSAVWSRLGEDYNAARGGLMGFGLLAMALTPLAAAHMRLRRRR